ncbi:MAG: hypothetical protein N2C12_05025, partial [Planctomycetales bacterium]
GESAAKKTGIEESDSGQSDSGQSDSGDSNWPKSDPPKDAPARRQIPDPHHASEKPAPPDRSIQQSLFALDDHPLLETIRTVDLNQTTPIEVLQLVDQWQKQLAAEDAGAQAKPR